MDVLFVLIHSPIVGPFTWSRVAENLEQRGIDVVVPAVGDTAGSGAPYWRQHAEAVASALDPVPGERPLILTGHSGAGMILPAVRQLTGRPVAAYAFVDAAIPENGMSRLHEMEATAPEVAEHLRQELASSGRSPTWTDEDLRKVIPDERLRRCVLAELHPKPRAFYDEPIPVFGGWPDAPCVFLLFSPFYEAAARQAKEAGWPCRKLEGTHFHLLIDPIAVTDVLLDLVQAAAGR